MKKEKLLLAFFVILLILTFFELIYFFYLKKQISQPLHQLTPKEITEVNRVRELRQRGEIEAKQREELIKIEAVKTANIKPFSQDQKCYTLSYDKENKGVVTQQQSGNSLFLEYEGKLDKVEEINKDGCKLVKLSFSYIKPYDLLLPIDFFWETESGRVNAMVLQNYLGKRIRLGLEYDQNQNQWTISKWKFTRFYVE